MSAAHACGLPPCVINLHVNKPVSPLKKLNISCANVNAPSLLSFPPRSIPPPCRHSCPSPAYHCKTTSQTPHGQNPDTRNERGAAQATLEAVLGRDTVRRPRVTLEQLLSHRNDVTRLLGCVKVVQEFNARR